MPLTNTFRKPNRFTDPFENVTISLKITKAG